VRRIWETFKLLVASLLLHTGALSLIISTKLRTRTTVLMYHRVINDRQAPLTNSNPGIIVSERSFDMQMETLRRYFNPVSLDEFQADIEGNVALPPRSCLVTFDDGWLDN